VGLSISCPEIALDLKIHYYMECRLKMINAKWLDTKTTLKGIADRFERRGDCREWCNKEWEFAIGQKCAVKLTAGHFRAFNSSR
jgi:hypothetical protein